MYPQCRVAFGEFFQQLYHLGQVIVTFGVRSALAGLEQKVASQKLKDHAREGSDVTCFVVANPKNDLWGSILSRLDLLLEVVVFSTCVPEIHYFHT